MEESPRTPSGAIQLAGGATEATSAKQQIPRWARDDKVYFARDDKVLFRETQTVLLDIRRSCLAVDDEQFSGPDGPTLARHRTQAKQNRDLEVSERQRWVILFSSTAVRPAMSKRRKPR